MRVFITGGTGFIGSAVVDELLGAGHEVIGLARFKSSAEWLVKMGATVFKGSIEDTESLKQGANSADAVIHMAFIHNFSDFEAAAEVDKRAISAIGEALSGSNRSFVITSGIPMGKNGVVVTEDTDSDTNFPRLSEVAVLPFVTRDVRVSIVRPSRFVHGEGDGGFTAQLVDIARKTGISAYVDDGSNRCQAVHRLDVACLFRLAIEKGIAGARYQAVADEGIAFRDIAYAIADKLGIPAVSIPLEEAPKHFGFLSWIVGADNPASSKKTKNTLGWQPTHPTLLQDLASDLYFA